ncbi:hypothetical protein ACWEC7_41750, partial [Streptomyces sp. NPDC005046]
AVRTYCAIISHHLGSIERFEPAVPPGPDADPPRGETPARRTTSVSSSRRRFRPPGSADPPR